MGIPALGVSIAELGAAVFSGMVFVRPRNIGGFVADVTIEEKHTDQLTITEHPVEQGANISDHSFKRPAKVIVTCGFSNSGFKAAFNPQYIDQMYQNFLALQSSRQLFSMQTGKRTYQNMLIHNLTVVTDANYENSLLMIIDCQELLLATTQTVSVGSNSNMTNPQSTGSTQNNGTSQLTSAPSYNSSATP